MSKENLEQFMKQVTSSEELQARIGDEIDAESLIALGAECGFEFTAEDLQETGELSEEELDGVAGGRLRTKQLIKMGWNIEANTVKSNLSGSAMGLRCMGGGKGTGRGL
tara:strand:+ start:71 stop:397 length:327 start_codon:yes stop_codon:yes gene_type:complete